MEDEYEKNLHNSEPHQSESSEKRLSAQSLISEMSGSYLQSVCPSVEYGDLQGTSAIEQTLLLDTA